MLGVLTLDDETGDFAAEEIGRTGDRVLSESEIIERFSIALDFQAERGGGVFWLNLAQ